MYCITIIVSILLYTHFIPLTCKSWYHDGVPCWHRLGSLLLRIITASQANYTAVISASLNSPISALFCSFASIFSPSSSEINHMCLEVFNMIPHNLHGWLGFKNSLTGHKTKTCASLLSKSSFLSPPSSLIKTVVKISPCSGTPCLILGASESDCLTVGKATKSKKGIVTFKLWLNLSRCIQAILRSWTGLSPQGDTRLLFTKTASSGKCTTQPEH